MSTTVSTIYEIKDVFNQDDWSSIDEKYSCTICTELIYKQEWYQCSEGHTGCANCWNKIISSSKQCPSCRLPVQSLKNGLSRCRYIEQEFTNIKISCPYSFNQSIINSRENRSTLVRDTKNGCKEIITVEQLDDHQKNCNSRFVKCNNDGCDNISRYNQHQQQHQNQCAHAIIQCELCKTSIKRSSLPNHQNECPSVITACNQCPLELKKSELQYHITNQCPNSIIECRLQAYGCNTQFKRSETSNHIQQVNHTEFMMKQIDQQSQQLKQQSDKLNQQSHQLGQQTQQLDQQTQQLNQQSQQLKQQSDKLNQQSQQLELFKEELESSNDKFNDILNKFNIVNLKLNNLVSYSNTWIISNFINKTGEGKPRVYSPIMNVSSYQFKLSTLYVGYQHYCLCVKGSENGKVKVKYSFKLLNCKDTLKSETINFENDFDINGQGWGGNFPTAKYSKESGYIFPDGSVHIEFTIDIPRAALQS